MGIDELILPYRDAVLAIAKQHGATRVRVFGSVARGTADRQSDIDLLIELEQPTTEFDRAALARALNAVLPLPVDVSLHDQLADHIRDDALRDAVAL